METHLQHLEEVLQTLQQQVAKLSKCTFGMLEVDYLRHTVSGQGVVMDKAKVQSVFDRPRPTTIKQLQGFLGLTGFYRRFIRSYATLALPLTNLIKIDEYEWNVAAEMSQLKRLFRN